MPLDGLLAYLNELSPVSLGPGAENDLPYQGAAGELDTETEMGLPPPGPELMGADEGLMPEEGMPLGEDVALEGEEGFPAMGGADSLSGMDPRMMLMAEELLGGARGPRLG